MVKRRKEKQQTLEATLGRPRVRPAIKTPKAKSKSKGVLGSPVSSSPVKHAKSSPMAPPSSFMHSSQVFGSATKKRVVLDDSSSEEEASEEDEVVKLPARKTKPGKKRGVSDPDSDGGSPAKDNGSDSDEGDEDDEPVVNPAAKRKRRIVAEDSDDEPLIPSSVKRRRLVRPNTVSSPAKHRNDENEDKDDEPAPSSSSVKPGRTRRRPLTQKEKARELLRRKRAGEVIPEENESSSSEEEEPTKALYDTDSDHLVLEEFEDDEEGILDLENDGKNGKSKENKKKKKKVADDDDSDSSMDDFVVDDSDAPIGAPDEHMEVPLELTSHYHKPLKFHFRFAIEWLVQFKINPEFSVKEDNLFKIAWKKLDDEVRGLAMSKFASAAWKTDFHLALRARPYLHNEELPKGVLDIKNCGACGRANHPARYTITFTGKPYFKNTAKLDSFLQPVELSDNSDDKNKDEGDGEDENEDTDEHKVDDEDEDEVESEGEDEEEEEYEDEDEDGNAIPKESKQWLVGVNCNQNAETAHYLMHWKHELLDWVDTRLHQEGYMLPHKVAEREKMDPEEIDQLVVRILDQWVNHQVVRELFQAFQGTIETARNQPTTGRRR